MKVLLVNSDDYRRGGGNIAMYRLLLGLRKAGVDAKILCRNKRPESSESVAIPRTGRMVRFESQLRKITSRVGLNDVHCLNTFSIKKIQAYSDADILNLHSIHGGFFNYLALPSLTARKPTAFTLHDMWSFTGHCSYSYDCDRWKIGCGKCPYPDIHPRIRRDNTRLEWKLKNWIYSRSNLAIVTISSWMTELAKQSMLNHLPIYQIPNGVDTELYTPLDREQCRSLLGIPQKRKVLMFSARSMDKLHPDGFRKGTDLLLNSLQALPRSLKAETTLILLGEGGEALAEAVGIQIVDLGYVSNDRLKAAAYSATDLFVFPTRADNMPLVLLESMACGTPMVSFRIGGVPDLVRHGVTGYLAEPENAKDLRNGIVQLLEDEALRHYMAQQCRVVAVDEYPLERQIQRYIELYCQLLQKPAKAGTIVSE
jgi:glycosyltransferase involved in cell wall biosynthesis